MPTNACNARDALRVHARRPAWHDCADKAAGRQVGLLMIAAGGIIDGGSVSAALAIRAAAVKLGTASLRVPTGAPTTPLGQPRPVRAAPHHYDSRHLRSTCPVPVQPFPQAAAERKLPRESAFHQRGTFRAANRRTSAIAGSRPESGWVVPHELWTFRGTAAARGVSRIHVARTRRERGSRLSHGT